MIAKLPPPPYYAVYFLSHQRESHEGYEEMAEKMVELASTQPGYLGIESLRNEEGWGVTVSYWESSEAIRAWKANSSHLEAQANGRKQWYDAYQVRVCKVERAYDFFLSENDGVDIVEQEK